MSTSRSSKKKGSGKSPGKKKSRTKKSGASRDKAQKDDSRQAVLNTVLFIIVLGLFLGAGYYIWVFLGRPGISVKPPVDHSARLELYFHDNTVAWLIPVHRNVVLDTGEVVTRRTIQEWATGPRDPSLARVYPSNIDIPEVTMEGETAVINLPKEILGHLGGTWKEQSFLDAIALTAASTDECSAVKLLMDGKIMEATPEGYEISNPMESPEVFNRVPDSALKGETDWVSVYFLDSTSTYLMPLSIQIPADARKWESAVEILLDHPPMIVQPSPMPVAPVGYTPEKVTIENGLATVDIGVPDPLTAFSGYDFNLFRLAVYLTLKKCCGVDDLVVQINGRDASSYTRFSELPDLNTFTSWNMEKIPVNSGEGSVDREETQ